jgi:uncharacterized membrane protein YcaP (DUF421 family)
MEIVVRAVIVYLLLWLLLRIMGKRELSELTAFELVLLVIIGDVVQQGVTQEDFSITGAFLSTGTIAFLIVMTSMIGWRWKKTRPVLEGVPVVLMRDGETIDEALRLEHVTLEELKEAARQEGIGDLAHVEWCVLERDGRFSFLRRVSDSS